MGAMVEVSMTASQSRSASGSRSPALVRSPRRASGPGLAAQPSREGRDVIATADRVVHDGAPEEAGAAKNKKSHVWVSPALRSLPVTRRFANANFLSAGVACDLCAVHHGAG